MSYDDDSYRGLTPSLRVNMGGVTWDDQPDRVRSIELQRQAAKKIYDERVAELDAELERVTRRLQVAEALGGEIDPFEDGTVLLVKLTFTRTPDQVYTYACLRARGHWYTTAANNSGAYADTWVKFLEWLTKDGRNVQSVVKMRSGRVLV